MPPTTYVYTNDFDNPESPASGNLTITLRPGVGVDRIGDDTIIQDSGTDGNSDDELVLFDGRQVGGYAEFAGETFEDDGSGTTEFSATSFTMTAEIDLIAGSGGGGEVDGFSFNFGAGLPAAGDGITTPGQGELENGVSEGLAIRFKPLAGTNGQVQIVWNGTVLTTTNVTSLEGEAAGTLTVSVSDTGVVNVTYGSISSTGTIPTVGGLSGFTEADQTDWDFSFAGRTGGNGGEVYVDDISLTANIICFATGTMIETDRGSVAVEALRAGDLVRTRDRGLQPIRWIGTRELTATQIAKKPALAPIRVSAGAFGVNTPSTDLRVSPQHRLLVRSKIAERMFDADEVLVAAKHLTELPGVEEMDASEGVTYHHVLFDNHEIIFANGLEAESLYTGQEMIKSVGPEALCEILTIFPELTEINTAPQSARQLVNGRRGRRLAERMTKNEKQPVAALEA